MRKSDDDWQAFLDDCWTQACKATKFTSEAQCPAILSGRGVKAAALSDGIKGLVAGEDLASLDMLIWIAFNKFEELSPDLRLEVLTGIARRDNPVACVIYQEFADLTVEEDALLWAAFKDTMPFMAGKFQRSPQLRAKNRG